ncbi:MAG: hypothetical protein ACMXYF_05430 [Candidatus Woesearchaeota archaeon]
MIEDNVVRTGVDSLVALLKEKGTISMQQAAKQLKVNESTMQTWVDFLVEDGLVLLEYKFVTPYLTLNTRHVSNFEIDDKQKFFNARTQKNIPLSQIKNEWNTYVLDNQQLIRKSFFLKAAARGLDAETVERLWQDYFRKLQE